MKKKAFTLVELMACIVILGVISVLALPPLLNRIRGMRTELSEASQKVIFSAAEMYFSDSENIHPKYNSYVYCVTLKELVNKNLLSAPVTDIVSGKEIDLDTKIQANVSDYNYHFSFNNDCVERNYYADNSGANTPDLLTNMVPIKYENNRWVYADIKNKWYDYDNKEWANAVVLNSGVTKKVGDPIEESEISLWYVWVPRYKYKLFNAANGSVAPQPINITFENGTKTTGNVSCVDKITSSGTVSQTCTNATNGNWYTHPAFTLGNQELTGIWVGKFEISTTDSTCNTTPNATNCSKALNVTIKPNVASWRLATVSKFYESIQNMSTTYGISDGDSHMIKNMEWGAVAYLSRSKYGINEKIYINNSSGYLTGRSGGNVGGSNNTLATQFPGNTTSTGQYNVYGYYTYDGKIVNYSGTIGDYATDRTLGTKASTTGNIYGIYDMSGGSYEYVMGNSATSSAAFYSSSAGFTTNPESKYYDLYTYNTSSVIHSRGKLGDATKETLSTYGSSIGGWYTGYAYFPYSSYSWFMRGGFYNNGANTGIFFFYYGNGTSNTYRTSRAVLTHR